MIKIFEAIFDWSEVWALLIPLLVIVIFRKQQKVAYLQPVSYYVYVAIILNSAANLIYNQKDLGLDLPWHNNVVIYNIHSIARLLLFAWFFNVLKQSFLSTIKKIIPYLFLIFVLVNFIVEPIVGKSISARLHIIEAFILLFYCLQYYLYLLKVEHFAYKSIPSFWVVTGLSIFVVTNFPVYLFYSPLTSQDVEFAIFIWKIHKIAHIVFCVFLAKAFYGPKQ
jgi:hypothetical protein